MSETKNPPFILCSNHKEVEMNDIERAVQAVEGGLLTANTIKGQLQERHNLRERMAYYKVPGFSIALEDQDEIAWTSGYGVIGYKLQMTEVGQSIDVLLYFEEGIDPRTAWLSLDGEFEAEDCTDLVDWLERGYVAVRSLTDGGEGDADGVANGTIVDFISPSQMDDRTPSSDLSDSPVSVVADGATGGGCFIGVIPVDASALKALWGAIFFGSVFLIGSARVGNRKQQKN